MSLPLQEAFARRVDGVSRESHWLVGLSGGADSTALLHLCASLQSTEKLTALHLNHCLRGAESDDDEEFCRDLCGRLGIELVCRRVDVARFCYNNHASPEDGARQCRREFFTEIAVRYQPAVVLLAHHFDDQIETVLQRLMRGSGWRGLAGIPAKGRILGFRQGISVPLYRPLLGFTREALVRWLQENGHGWREDSSNMGNDYQRNRLRNGVLPALRVVWPDIRQKLADLAAVAASEDCRIQQQADAIARTREYGGWFFPYNKDMPFEPFVRAVEDQAQLLAGELRFNSRSVGQLQLLYDQQIGAVDLPGNLRLRQESDGYFLYRVKGYPLAPDVYQLDLSGCVVKGGDWAFSLERVELDGTLPEKQSREVEYIPLSLVCGGLRLRGAQAGERIAAAGGRKKVSDIFNENSTPLRQRENALVLADDAGIWWLPPLRVSERILTSAENFSGTYLRVSYHRRTR